MTIVALLTALPVAMLAVGALYIDKCPVERWIPIYLIVAGLLQILKTGLNFSFRIRQKRTGEEQPSGTPACIDSTLTILIFSWFIAGKQLVRRLC